MHKLTYLLLLVMLATASVQAQYQWSSNLNTNVLGQIANPYAGLIQPYGEKSVVKCDANGAVYSLSRTYSAGLGGYYPMLIKQNAAGSFQWNADPGFNPGGNNFYVIDLDINQTTGQSYCLLGRIDQTYFRLVSYDASGNWQFTYDGFPYYQTPDVFTNTANDMVYYNNHVYILETIPRGGPVTTKVTDINVPALTVSNMDTVSNFQAGIGFGIDAASSGVYVAGYGAANYKWFTSVTRYSFSGLVKYCSRTDNLFPARGGKNEIPMQLKCSIANGLPYIVGYTTDTIALSTGTAKSRMFIMKPTNNTTGAGFKFKEYDITANKTDLPYSMEFNSTGSVFVAGSTGKNGFATLMDPSTLLRKWTTKVSAPDSILFTATAASGDKLVAIGQQYKSGNNTLQTAAVRFNTDGTYGGIVYGVAPAPGDKYEINNAVFDNFATGSKINCAGRFSQSAPLNGLYTTQFSIVGFPAVMPQNTLVVDAVKNIQPNGLTIQAYPNPAKNTITICYTAFKSNQAAISIMDMNGKQVYQNNQRIVAGTNIILIDVSKLTSANN